MKGTDSKGPEGTATVLNISAPNKLLRNKKQGRLLHLNFDTHADNEKFSKKHSLEIGLVRWPFLVLIPAHRTWPSFALWTRTT